MPGAQQVDSRIYAHAYLTRSLAHLPHDFPAAAAREGFDLGILLPMDQAGSEVGPRYPARIILLQDDKILCATDSSEHPGEVGIPKKHILARETGEIFWSMWIRFFTAHHSYWWPSAAHNADVVGTFLGRLKELLFRDAPLHEFRKAVNFGGPLSVKLANAESTEVQAGDGIRLHCWFEESPAERMIRRRRPLSEYAKDYLAVTSRRLLWITDRVNGHAQPYGALRSSFPLRKLASVNFIPGSEKGKSVGPIALAGGIGRHILVSSQQEDNACAFVAETQRLLSSCEA